MNEEKDRGKTGKNNTLGDITNMQGNITSIMRMTISTFTNTITNTSITNTIKSR